MKSRMHCLAELRNILSSHTMTTALVLGSTFLLGTIAAYANAPNLNNEKDAIVRLEHEWLNALNDADVQTIGNILADDFERPAPMSGGFIHKQALLRYYRSSLSRSKELRRIKLLTVTIYGHTAIARGIVLVPAPRSHIERALLFTDVFVLRNGTWKAVSAQENEAGTPK